MIENPGNIDQSKQAEMQLLIAVFIYRVRQLSHNKTGTT